MAHGGTLLSQGPQLTSTGTVQTVTETMRRKARGSGPQTPKPSAANPEQLSSSCSRHGGLEGWSPESCTRAHSLPSVCVRELSV